MSVHVAKGSDRCSVSFHNETAVSYHHNAIGNALGSELRDLAISIAIDLEKQSIQSDLTLIFMFTKIGLFRRSVFIEKYYERKLLNVAINHFGSMRYPWR